MSLSCENGPTPGQPPDLTRSLLVSVLNEQSACESPVAVLPPATLSVFSGLADADAEESIDDAGFVAGELVTDDAGALVADAGELARDDADAVEPVEDGAVVSTGDLSLTADVAPPDGG